jgi:uncharacterized caspase-like protein
MGRTLAFLAVLVTALLSVGQLAGATPDGKRVALVIGNSAYRHAVTLPNPKADAALMAKTLRAAGFTVVEGSDLDKAGMNALLDQFTEAAYEAEVALVYYAGHGLQVDGHNYLIPVDAQLEKAAQLQTRTVAIDKILSALPPDPAVAVVILDACRDNPLARTLARALPASRSSSLGAGLAAVQANGESSGSGGLLIAYATDPGAVAYDGKDVNSPYTAALARHLTTPGLEIQSALTRVRAEVSDATKGAQRPWHNASLARELFLGGAAPKATVQPGQQLTLGNDAAPPAAKSDIDWTIEQKLWDEASKRNTVAHYELYLQQFPNGSFAKLASLNIDQLRQDGTHVAALAAPAGEATATASQIRTAVAIPDEVKQAPGTAETEAQLALDREGRIDLQLRLGALGHATGGADGALGPRSRSAIAGWQRQNGIAETTFLTPRQHMLLVVQTDPLMAKVRAQYESDKRQAAENQRQKAKAAEAQRQKARKAAAAKAAEEPKKARKVAKQAPQRKQPTARRQTRRPAERELVREVEREPVRESGGILGSPEGAAFVGGLVGGAIGRIIVDE